MQLIDIMLRLEPRTPGGEQIVAIINPKYGTTIGGTTTLFPAEIELVNAINVLLKERRDHIQTGATNGSDGN